MAKNELNHNSNHFHKTFKKPNMSLTLLKRISAVNKSAFVIQAAVGTALVLESTPSLALDIKIFGFVTLTNFMVAWNIQMAELAIRESQQSDKKD